MPICLQTTCTSRSRFVKNSSGNLFDLFDIFLFVRCKCWNISFSKIVRNISSSSSSWIWVFFFGTFIIRSWSNRTTIAFKNWSCRFGWSDWSNFVRMNSSRFLRWLCCEFRMETRETSVPKAMSENLSDFEISTVLIRDSLLLLFGPSPPPPWADTMGRVRTLGHWEHLNSSVLDAPNWRISVFWKAIARNWDIVVGSVKMSAVHFSIINWNWTICRITLTLSIQKNLRPEFHKFHDFLTLREYCARLRGHNIR